MSTVTTKDSVEIYYKDWGGKDAQPIVFHHGWPLSSDDWDNQMLGNGYRVVGSAQVSDELDIDHYAVDAAVDRRLGTALNRAAQEWQAEGLRGRPDRGAPAPLGEARLGRIGLDKWLRRTQATAWSCIGGAGAS